MNSSEAAPAASWCTSHTQTVAANQLLSFHKATKSELSLEILDDHSVCTIAKKVRARCGNLINH
jgi:hypothetical protein